MILLLLAGCDPSSPTSNSTSSLQGPYRLEMTMHPDCPRDVRFRVLRFDVTVSSSGGEPGDVVLASLPAAEDVFAVVATYGAPNRLIGTLVDRGTNPATGRPIRFADQASRVRTGENAIWLEGQVTGSVNTRDGRGQVLDGVFYGQVNYEANGPDAFEAGGCSGHLHSWTLRPN